MKIIIVEDEERTAHRLEKLLREMLSELQVVARIHSAKMLRNWLENAQSVDLIFMDIDLGDGLSLDVLKDYNLKTPLIFTTAYNQYALEAFKANSIDYLLKPIKVEDLQRALKKLELLKEPSQSQINIAELSKMILGEKTPYQQRFLVKFPEEIKVVDIDEVAYFYIESRINFMRLKSGKSYPVDFSMDQLEERLSPARFFRLNRQVMTSFEAVSKMIPYPKSRVKLILNPPVMFEVMVSSEKSAAFKDWIQGV